MQILTRRAMLARTVTAAAAMAAAPHLRAAAAFAPAENFGGEIWDVHVHLGSGTVEDRVSLLLKCADRVGIARLIVHLGTQAMVDPSPAKMRQRNDEVLRAIELAPKRISGFVFLTPKHVEESLAEIDRCVRDGPMLGVKLWVTLRCNRSELDPIALRAGELRIPILQHCYRRVEPSENGAGESFPSDLAELATRHPNVNFICAHTGNDWERGIREIRAAKNVCVEISGSDPTAGFVEMAVREVGPERVCYGSDAGGRSFASQLAKAMSADVPESAKRLILGGNLRRLLQPILEKKGLKS